MAPAYTASGIPEMEKKWEKGLESRHTDLVTKPHGLAYFPTQLLKGAGEVLRGSQKL